MDRRIIGYRTKRTYRSIQERYKEVLKMIRTWRGLGSTRIRSGRDPRGGQ